jgi:hypothetical protein
MDGSRRASVPGRKGRVLALLTAAGFFAVSVAAPWSWVYVALFVITRDGNLLAEDGTTSEYLWQSGPPGVLHAGLGALLLVLVGVAVFRGLGSRPLLVAGAVIAGLALVDLLVAWQRFLPAREDAVRKWAELTRLAAAAQPADKDTALFDAQAPGIFFGLLTVLVVLMTVVAVVRPGHGGTITAAAGLLLFAFCLISPWATTYRATGDAVEQDDEWWFQMGPATAAVVAGTAVLAALAWFAAVRRSTGGRLPLLLCSLPLAPALFAAQLLAPVEADDRLPATEPAPYLNVDTEARAAAALNLFVLAVLGVSALLSWHAARQRARTPGTPAEHTTGTRVTTPS